MIESKSLVNVGLNDEEFFDVVDDKKSFDVVNGKTSFNVVNGKESFEAGNGKRLSFFLDGVKYEQLKSGYVAPDDCAQQVLTLYAVNGNGVLKRWSYDEDAKLKDLNPLLKDLNTTHSNIVILGNELPDSNRGSNGLFQRCFCTMRFGMIRYVDGREKEFERNSVDAYCDMTKAAKMFKIYNSSRFKILGPNERGQYKVSTAHDFGNGLKFESHWTTLAKGKELVAYKACKYFGFPNPYPVSWLVKSDIRYLERAKRLRILRKW